MKISDEEIIAAILTTPTNKQAANKLGIHERTLQSRIAKPGFKEKLDTARAQMMQDAVELAQKSLCNAVMCMASIIQDKHIAPQVRLNAADALIRNSVKLSEQNELRQRIEALEAFYNADKGSEDI